VFLVAVQDEVRAFVVVEEAVVGEDARELEDAVADGVQSAHLQVHPQVVGNEIDTHTE
jgi:hypothetical protein